MNNKLKQSLKYSGIIIILFIIFTVGYLYAGIKFAKPHHHANFIMYVDGDRVNFDDDKYSEDIGKCKIDGEMSPNDRVHLHENNQDTIHVHHEGVAWGHFFSNNGFTFGEKYIIIDTGEIFEEMEIESSGTYKMTYVLNGKVISNPFNRMIRSEDQLLINYGIETEEFLLETRFNQVSTNAGEYNHKYDPGTCSGTNENSMIFLIKQLLHINH